VTGLVAGGASCAAIQGGLLAGLVARRRPVPSLAVGDDHAGGVGEARRQPARLDDAIPVGGFLAGKLVSHTVLGFARLVPEPPQRWTRLFRRNARSTTAGAPAVLGLASVLIPCGVTLSVEFLAIASGSAVTGAAIMAAFVLGTAPLFAVLGYAARRSATMLRGQLAKVAAVAVVVTGLLSINAGLVLSGSSTTLATMWASLADRQRATPAPGDAAAAEALTPSEDGVQRIVVTVSDTGYNPAVVWVKADVPAQVTFRTNGTQGCTRTLVVPSLKVGKQLPATGSTTLDLGQLAPGLLRYTCGMGMYSGTIEAT